MRKPCLRRAFQAAMAAVILMTAVPVVAQEAELPSPPEGPPAKYVVRILVPGSAFLDRLLREGLDIAGNFKRVPDGIEVDIVTTEEKIQALEAQGVQVFPAASEESMRESSWKLPAEPRKAIVRKPAPEEFDSVPVQLAPDVVKVGRVDWFTTKGQGFLYVEAKTSLGSTSSVTLRVAYDTGPGTAPGSGGNVQMSRFVDVVYLYHRILIKVGAAGANGPRPHQVVVTSSRTGSDLGYVSDWTYPVTPMTAAKGYKYDFNPVGPVRQDGYRNATELYAKIDQLAAEFPSLTEIIQLPNKSNGYRRKAQVILGATNNTAAQQRAVVITSNAWGHEGGNLLSAQIVIPAVPSSPLTVEKVGNLIKISSATNAAGAATSTALQVVTALNAQLGDVVHAFRYRTVAGTGIVQAVPATALRDFLAAPQSISREPWPIRAIRIGKHRNGSKVGVFVIANDHAREWVTPLVAIETAERLLRNYATDPATRAILESVDIFIIPTNNPDGNHRTFFDDTGQRRTLTNHCPDTNSDPNRRNDWGVDLNRNYRVASGFDGYDGASSSCIDDTYQGPAELSEPETKNIVWLVEKYKNIKFFMTIHSNGGQLFWQPGAYKLPNREATRPPFKDEAFYWQMAERILSHVKAYQDTPVTPENVGGSADVLYSSAGNVREELYFTYGIWAMGWEIGGSVWNPATQTWQDGAFQPNWTRAHGEAMEYANGVMEFFRIAADWAKDKNQPTSRMLLTKGFVAGTDVDATDDNPIEITGGTFSGPVAIRFETGEPATIYYTIDGSRPTLNSFKYTEGAIREGTGQTLLVEQTTTFRWFSVDTAGNIENHYDPKSIAKNYKEATIVIQPAPPAATATRPAKLWLGVSNSDNNGLRVDVRVEVLADGAVVSARDINDVSAGGPGFNNAILRTLRLPVVTPPTTGQTDFRVSVRRTCFGSGHASGSVRLWYNGPAVDSGATRGAGSRFQSPVDETGITYYLRTGATLSQTAGTAAAYKDVQVSSAEVCSPSSPTTRSFTPVETWSLSLP